MMRLICVCSSLSFSREAGRSSCAASTGKNRNIEHPGDAPRFLFISQGKGSMSPDTAEGTHMHTHTLHKHHIHITHTHMISHTCAHTFIPHTTNTHIHPHPYHKYQTRDKFYTYTHTTHTCHTHSQHTSPTTHTTTHPHHK